MRGLTHIKQLLANLISYPEIRYFFLCCCEGQTNKYFVEHMHFLFLLFFFLFFFSGEGPRSRRYGRTAAMRLIVQLCDEDGYYFLSFS
jgi:hypothetical protein